MLHTLLSAATKSYYSKIVFVLTFFSSPSLGQGVSSSSIAVNLSFGSSIVK